VNTYLNQVSADRGLTPTTLKSHLNLIHKILAVAEREGIIERTPRLPSVKRNETNRTWFNEDDYNRLVSIARDAAKIILWLAENYDGAEPVNIGNPEQISIMSLADIIAEEIGYDGGRIFDKIKPDGQYQKPSSNKKLMSLGWHGEYTPLREGLRATIKSFQSRYPNVRGVKI
jgi:nucleoside-diphosphate-sugar epimerase